VALLKLLPPGGGVRLVGAQERVVALLRLTRLDRVFRVFPTVEVALAA
jgi:anti-anti-sigma regulatory factor